MSGKPTRMTLLPVAVLLAGGCLDHKPDPRPLLDDELPLLMQPAPPEALSGRCARKDERKLLPQGTDLYGLRLRDPRNAEGALFHKVRLGDFREAGAAPPRIEGARLGGPAGDIAIGALFNGRLDDGSQVPIDVAICDVQAAPGQPDVPLYNLQFYNAAKARWENACRGTEQEVPRAIALRGAWERSGAHREAEGEFTFACENAVLAKCVLLGYKPWQVRDGRSLAEHHQACTRMLRADYCGDGQSHTRPGTIIDVYDDLRLVTPGARADLVFEAAWGPGGALCLNHTRFGGPAGLAEISRQCGSRLVQREATLAGGERCALGAQGTPLVFNRSRP